MEKTIRVKKKHDDLKLGCPSSSSKHVENFKYINIAFTGKRYCNDFIEISPSIRYAPSYCWSDNNWDYNFDCNYEIYIYIYIY